MLGQLHEFFIFIPLRDYILALNSIIAINKAIYMGLF